MTRVANEAELIETYLAPLAAGCPGALGLKDDAAFLTLPPKSDLVVTTDPIIAGVHFFPDEAPENIAWKALAVNISDLSAKGAQPLAYTMALAFPEPPEKAWMERFARGLSGAQNAFGCTLVGGDTDRTPGPLSISITAFGSVPEGKMVRRGSAKIGDHVFLTGSVGDAAIGLALRRDASAFADILPAGDKDHFLSRYLRPTPRPAMAPILCAHASAALDVSDGIAKDLAKLAAGAGGGVKVLFARLPLTAAARMLADRDSRWRRAILAGGDDYEIVFSVSPDRLAALRAACRGLPFAVTEIGTIEPQGGVQFLGGNGEVLDAGLGGYDHFA